MRDPLSFRFFPLVHTCFSKNDNACDTIYIKSPEKTHASLEYHDGVPVHFLLTPCRRLKRQKVGPVMRSLGALVSCTGASAFVSESGIWR